MRTRIVAIVIAVVLLLGLGAIVLTPPASASDPARCSWTVGEPWRVGRSDRIVSSSTVKKVAGGREKKCGLIAKIMVWAPNGRGGGAYRDVGTPDADGSAFRRATAVPSTTLLFGKNKYITRVTIWADNGYGDLTLDSKPVEFDRPFVVQRRPKP